MTYFYLIVAIVLIVFAHLVRIIRWGLFINIYEKPKKKSLINATSIGYLVNYIVPFRFGDIIRAWYSSRKMKTGKALALSTVIMDRFLDIVSVGIIFLILSFGNNNMAEDMRITANFYIIVTVLLMTLGIFLFLYKRYVKKGISAIARIFNDKIESSILRFSFALISNFKNIIQKISHLQLVFTTIGMWTLYILSYYMFTTFLSLHGQSRTTWIDIFTILFAQNSIVSSTGKITFFWQNETMTIHPYYMLIYIISPLLVLLFIAMQFNDNQEFIENENHYINLLPHMDHGERLIFLENYFSDNNKEYVINYLKINQDVSIIRDYSAGSNATTMLCMDEKQTFFRKYAFGKDGDKLYQQVQWLENNANKIALPNILKQNKTEIYCFYDMPYNSHAVGLFEYVHSMPIFNSWQMIQNVLESLENSIYKIDVRKADKETIDKYIEEKVKKNIDKIKKAKRLSVLQQYDTIFINGVKYKNLSYYEKYLNKNYLKKVFVHDNYAVIHGDLTIENIICTRNENGKDDFYIIDPNTGNVHDSPNLDYGKLLQSIHGGYEFLMSTKDVTVKKNHINFLFTRSSAYIELHNMLKTYMQSNFGQERTRSIYFHEIIHWLRLMPYKIEKDGKRTLLFYAGMLMVMNDVLAMYGDVD